MMRLIVECEHGTGCAEHPWGQYEITDPDAILAALVEAGLLEMREQNVELGHYFGPCRRFVSPWKESE